MGSIRDILTNTNNTSPKGTRLEGRSRTSGTEAPKLQEAWGYVYGCIDHAFELAEPPGETMEAAIQTALGHAIVRP